MLRPIACILACSAFLYVAGQPGLASAQRRVSVQSFVGPHGSSLRGDMIRSLQEENDVVVVPSAEVDAAAEAQGIHGSIQPSQYAAVGAAANISAFVRGSASRRRGRWVLTISVYSGADGSRVGAASITGRTLGALSTVRRVGYARIRSLLEQTEPGTPVQAQPVVDPNAQPWYARNDEPELAEPPEEDDTPSAPPGRWRALRVGLLVGTLRRSMSSEALVDPVLRGGAPGGSLIPEGRSYQSAGLGAMEAGLGIELYPGSFGEEAAFPYLGFLFSYRHSVGLTTNAPACGGNVRCTSPTPEVAVATTETELYLGARLRYGIDDDTTIFADVGYGSFQFALASNDLALVDGASIVPTLAYSHIKLGAGFRYDVAPRLFTLGARFAYLAGLGVGDEGKRIWGTQTSSTGGFSLGLDLESELFPIADGVFARVSVEYFRFKTTFRGQTACREPDSTDACAPDTLWEPWPTDASGNLTGGFSDPVKDGYVRLGLMVGYEY
ncbi:MAG: hypothetical protein GW913_13330 [Myxococcales bacterium]|nr:hypothetical protein [Myxococcales bacterium]